MKKQYYAIAAAVMIVLGFIMLRTSESAASFLWSMSGEGSFLLPLVIFSALLDSINPCAFSILLVTIALLFALGASRGRMLQVGGVYILGIFIAYILIGLGILEALHLFGVPHFMGKLGALVMIALGALSLAAHYIPNFRWSPGIPQSAHLKMAELMKRSTMPALFALGVLVGLCEFPCTGGPYLMIIGLLHDSATYASGLGYLFLYNIVFILPLVLTLLIVGNEKVLEKINAWRKSEIGNIRLITGAAMVLLGILILFI